MVACYYVTRPPDKQVREEKEGRGLGAPEFFDDPDDLSANRTKVRKWKKAKLCVARQQRDGCPLSGAAESM
jgi:hypothetical protein